MNDVTSSSVEQTKRQEIAETAYLEFVAILDRTAPDQNPRQYERPSNTRPNATRIRVGIRENYITHPLAVAGIAVLV